MAAPNAKKRTLSELKESDTLTKTDPKQGDTENAVEDIDTFNTFRAYVDAKGKAHNPAKHPFFLLEEYEELPPSATLNDVLNRVHAILVPESTNKSVDQTRESIEQIYQDEAEAEEEEEEEEPNDDAKNALIAKKIEEYLKKELTVIKNAWNGKNYSQAFDVLFAITYEGLAENDPSWAYGENDSKKEFEETLQGIVDVWSQLLGQSEKESHGHHHDQHLNLSASDKHFIHALLESLEKRCKKDNFKCTFHKIKLPTLETLDWNTEQKKYNVTVVMKEEEEVNESGSDSENEEESEDEGNEDDDEDEGGGAADGAEAVDENGEVEPPTKKKKT